MYDSHEARLKLCSLCQHRKIDLRQGMHCGLTGLKPEFTEHCTDHLPDESVQREIEIPRKEHDLPLAGKGHRIGNLLIDSVFLVLFGSAAGFLIGYVALQIPGMLNLLNWMVFPNFWQRLLLNIVFGTAFYVLFETVFGASPGKLFTRTRTVNVEGDRASFGQIFKRTLIRYVPFEAFSFFNVDTVGWHDEWSNTRVIKLDADEPKRWPLLVSTLLVGGLGVATLLFAAGIIHNRFDKVLESESKRAYKIAYKGITFDISDNWDVSYEEIEEDLSYQISCVHKGMHSNKAFVVIFVDGEIDAEDWIEESKQILLQQDVFRNARFDDLYETEFQDKAALKYNFNGSLLGNRYAGSITVFYLGGKTIMIIKTAGNQEELLYDFELLESSLRAEQNLL
ncbi:MAG: RDD family protein [Bacteroidia bacterium]